MPYVLNNKAAKILRKKIVSRLITKGMTDSLFLPPTLIIYE